MRKDEVQEASEKEKPSLKGTIISVKVLVS